MVRRHMQSSNFYPKPQTYRRHMKRKRRRRKLSPLDRDETAEEQEAIKVVGGDATT